MRTMRELLRPYSSPVYDTSETTSVFRLYMEKYLQSMLTEEPKNMRAHKLLVNTFMREILLYDDEVIITYNLT